MQAFDNGPLTIAFRPHHLSPTPQSIATAQLQATVMVTEITGSESFIHLAYGSDKWVMLTKGVHDLAPGTSIIIYLDTRHLLAFRDDGTNASSALRLAA
jgi:glycerol transport system ATP-binding protein